jgi:hypothetical protein
MKGYLNFLLVFASVFFILILINASQITSSISFSKAIAAERVYQVQMNSKEIITESIRVGGREGFRLYNSTHFEYMCHPQFGGQTDPLCFRSEEAAIWTKAGAYIYLAKVDGRFDSDIQVEISCRKDISDIIALDITMDQSGLNYPGLNFFLDSGVNISNYSIELIQDGPKDSKGPLYSLIKGPACMELIYPLIEENPANKLVKDSALLKDPTLLKNPELKNIRIIDGVILTNAFYEEFNISSVSYIPSGYEVIP